MRLWSIHPKYLDRQGLVALWREGLLAQAVLHGATNGYKNHPQLDRFKGEYWPARIGLYLWAVYHEAKKRGYNFDFKKICWSSPIIPDFMIRVTSGQIEYEAQHLFNKICDRSWDSSQKDDLYACLTYGRPIETHPLFTVIDGPIELWEKVK